MRVKEYQPISLKLSQVTFKLSQVILKLSQVILKLSQVILKLSQVTLKLSQVTLKLSQVTLKLSQVTLKHHRQTEKKDGLTRVKPSYYSMKRTARNASGHDPGAGDTIFGGADRFCFPGFTIQKNIAGDLAGRGWVGCGQIDRRAAFNSYSARPGRGDGGRFGHVHCPGPQGDACKSAGGLHLKAYTAAAVLDRPGCDQIIQEEKCAGT